MKFVILLLAFFIPLFTSTGGLKCYDCVGTKVDCSKSNGEEQTCELHPDFLDEKPEHLHCNTFTPDSGKAKDFSRGCAITDGTVFKPGCEPFGTVGNNFGGKGIICECNTDLCNVIGLSLPLKNNNDAVPTTTPGINTNIVSMSVTTLLGGVMALSII